MDVRRRQDVHVHDRVTEESFWTRGAFKQLGIRYLQFVAKRRKNQHSLQSCIMVDIIKCSTWFCADCTYR